MENTSKEDFLGKGWSFPVCFHKATSTVNLVEGEMDVKRSLKVLLTTYLGERTLQPDYGCNLFLMQFETMDASMRSDIAEMVESAVIKFEPRVEVDDVQLEVFSSEGKAEVHLKYTVIQTNSSENLVFPFYLNQ